MCGSETTMAPPFETLTGEPLSPAQRRKLVSEITNGDIRPGGTRVSIRNVRDNRLLMTAICQTVSRLKRENLLSGRTEPVSIDRWPDRYVDIETIIRNYVPTAYLLEPMDWDEEIAVSIDEDWGRDPNFVSAFSVYQHRGQSPFDSRKVFLVKGCVQPSCTTSESLARKQLMRLHHRGITVAGNEGYQADRLSEKLLADEWIAAEGLSPADQLALMMILAADTGIVAFMSADGIWPLEPLVVSVSERLDVQIVRFDYSGIPQEVMRRLPHVKYDSYEDVPGR